MRDKFSRRDFLKTGIGIGAASMFTAGKNLAGEEKKAGKMCVVSSRNGLRATEKAMELLRQGKDPLDAVIAGVNIVESDPNDRSVEIWLQRKEMLSDRDFWFAPKPEKLEKELESYLGSYGTINCCAIDASGNLAGVTTTSGFFFKIPGRVGDSPIIGAGLYVDNDVGAAGSTGRGEANILNCGSFQVVNFMSRGFSPEEACLKSLEQIADKSKLLPHLLNEKGLPRFGLNFYAVNKKGEYGGASMWSGRNFAVHDGKENKLRPIAYLYKKEK